MWVYYFEWSRYVRYEVLIYPATLFDLCILVLYQQYYDLLCSSSQNVNFLFYGKWHFCLKRLSMVTVLSDLPLLLNLFCIVFGGRKTRYKVWNFIYIFIARTISDIRKLKYDVDWQITNFISLKGWSYIRATVNLVLIVGL